MKIIWLTSSIYIFLHNKFNNKNNESFMELFYQTLAMFVQYWYMIFMYTKCQKGLHKMQGASQTVSYQLLNFFDQTANNKQDKVRSILSTFVCFQILKRRTSFQKYMLCDVYDGDWCNRDSILNKQVILLLHFALKFYLWFYGWRDMIIFCFISPPSMFILYLDLVPLKFTFKAIFFLIFLF